MKLNNKSGFAWIPVLLGVIIIGAVGTMFKPKIFHGESRRADAVATSAKAVNDATQQKDGTAAASFLVIGKAAGDLPNSPQKGFIAHEASYGLMLLGAPNAEAQLQSEKRYAAYLEGKLDTVSSLYDDAAKRAEQLNKKYVQAVATNDRTVLELQKVAAEHLASERDYWRIFWVCAALGALYVYTKFTHMGPGAIAEMAADIKGGANPTAALDGVTTRLQQRISRFINKLKQ